MKMTEAQRARVHPLRGDDVALPKDSKEGWRVLLLWREEYGKYWERGVAHAKEPHRSRMKSSLDELANGERGATDPACEAGLMFMLDYWSRRGLVVKGVSGDTTNARYRPVDEWFVRRWMHAGGIPFALQVLAAFPNITHDLSRAGRADTHTLSLTDGEGKWWALESGHLGVLHTLRKFVVADTKYEDGVRAAAKLRESAPDWMRAALAFVFPDEAGFFEPDAKAAIPKGAKAKTPPWSWGLVTTRLADERKLLRILESVAKDPDPWVTDTEQYGFSLVSRLGDDAAPFLVHALELMRAKSAKAAFGEALALTKHEAARTFFERNAKNAAFKALAKTYLDQ